MEQGKGLEHKLNDLKKAVKSFADSLKVDLTNFDETLIDVIKNGQIQKFEYTFELLWKYFKKYLWEIHGIDAKSPKHTIKETYLTKIISNEEYELFIEMLNNRNLISHVYREEFFSELSSKLIIYMSFMKKILENLEK